MIGLLIQRAVRGFPGRPATVAAVVAMVAASHGALLRDWLHDLAGKCGCHHFLLPHV